MTSYTAGTIWMLLALSAAGTWALRLSFIAMLGKSTTIPPLGARILALIPAAVLAALVAPSLTHATGTLDPGSERFIAGVLAAVVAWRTKNVLATIGAGMAALWMLQAIT